MAFTRYHDDPVRINKYLEESTFSGRYFLNTPGAGLQLPFQEEPQLRLQRWGANLMTDTTNLESDLFGLGRKLTHDYDVTYKQQTVSNPTTLGFVSQQPFVEESRATHPSWMYRDLEQPRWEVPFINPQAHLEKEFHSNLHTRILEKDNFRPQLPALITENHGYSFLKLPTSTSQNSAFSNSQMYE